MPRSTRSNAKHLISGRVIEESSQPFSPGDPLDEDDDRPTTRQKQKQLDSVTSAETLGDSSPKSAGRKVHYATKSLKARRRESSLDESSSESSDDSETNSESSEDRRSFGSELEELGSDVSSHSSGFMDSDEDQVDDGEAQPQKANTPSSSTGKKQCAFCDSKLERVGAKYCSRLCSNRHNADKHKGTKRREREVSLQSSGSRTRSAQRRKKKSLFPTFFDDDLESESVYSENLKPSTSKISGKTSKPGKKPESDDASRQSPEIELPSPTSSRATKPSSDPADSKPERRRAAKYVSQVAREYLSHRSEFVQKLITEKPVASWDVMETAAFIQSVPTLEYLTAHFVENEIDGQCLLLFDVSTWSSGFGIKIGHATKVWDRAQELLNIQRTYVLEKWYKDLPTRVAEAVAQMEATSIKA
ncbi:hypothetical protein RvY_10365 [Ramazzottius varieornatus]|uniref:SAM domain-containing protein n=1 Tax=Ramazzottius varieornatus TaxID=947166 RepID=A0A1D1VCH7_RAMVA|nr:hypothetical protein RvY_10365 [Ramazzottius varieornatus]